MKTCIALFRGINVGGHNSLPMRELVGVLEGLGLQNIKTYIQSGNVVFQRGKSSISGLADRISEAINQSHGFRPQVFLLELDEMENAIASNPFPEAESEPKTLHLYFLVSVPKHPDLKTLEGIKRESERFKLKGKVFYLHAPEGIGKSKLAVRAEKLLGIAVTARNWRTVCKILTMAKQYD
jgi:uncharacterized protein (DUF1697 family)